MRFLLKSPPFWLPSYQKGGPGQKIQKNNRNFGAGKKVGISGREYHIRDQRRRFLPEGFEITELGRNNRVTIKSVSRAGIPAPDTVIRVRGAIWSAGDGARASGTALASRLSREVRLPGWLDPGSGITRMGPRW